ncbi:MAG TPA: hypothetical protein VEW04_06015 [Allosphingosinicella sp.]|nr:hypothetical protein [Allosphingosinicella sp.]
MRFLLPMGAALAFLAAAPAQADTTARYGGAGNQAPTVSIAVDEAGQVHVEGGQPNQPDQRMVLITRGGVGYFSGQDVQGSFVARQDDMLAVVNDAIRRAMPVAVREALAHVAQARFEIVEGGIETVAGRRGRVYTLRAIVPPAPVPASAHGGDGTENPDAPPPPFEMVISDDPELAPVGRELARLFASGGPLIEAVLGAVPEAVTQMQSLLARGTPIRIGDQFHLSSVSAAPIPDRVFALPATPLTRAQLAERMPASFAASARPRSD